MALSWCATGWTSGSSAPPKGADRGRWSQRRPPRPRGRSTGRPGGCPTARTTLDQARRLDVQPYPDGGRRWLVSRGGGSGARWLRSGREIVYQREPNDERGGEDREWLRDGGSSGAVRGAERDRRSLSGLGRRDGGRRALPDGEGPEGPGPQIVVAPGFLHQARRLARLRAAAPAPGARPPNDALGGPLWCPLHPELDGAPQAHPATTRFAHRLAWKPGSRSARPARRLLVVHRDGS